MCRHMFRFHVQVWFRLRLMIGCRSVSVWVSEVRARVSVRFRAPPRTIKSKNVQT